MSRRINVNPGQYKVAGRERQGEDILQERHRRRKTTTDAAEAGTRPAQRRSQLKTSQRSRRQRS